MIIDDTFTALYLLYKVGCAIGTVSIACFGIILIWIMCVKGYKPEMKKLFLWTVALIALGSLTPSCDEVKAYAIYAISRDAANSETAQRLTEATINFLEGKAPSDK